MLDIQTTVARAVLDHSECASVFQRHRIDFCCKGDWSIAKACEQRGLEPVRLLHELESAIAERTGASGADPQSMSTPSLIAYIISKYHDSLRKTLPFVRDLAAKVARVHGAKEPRLIELDVVVRKLADALEPHLDTEEQVLFPALMARDGETDIIRAELDTMKDEHLAVGEMLEQMRTLAFEYRAPEGACNSYRALFSELDQLEGDVLRHVHLENHVLLPRFAT